MTRYKCTRCNYIYDPANGEPPEIKPGTAFKDLPDNWVCPSCGVSSKRTFKKIEE